MSFSNVLNVQRKGASVSYEVHEIADDFIETKGRCNCAIHILVPTFINSLLTSALNSTKNIHLLRTQACSMKACFTCCTDPNCEGHREQYERLSIVEGTHPLQKLASKQRASAVKIGAFRDDAFHFLGETINVWDFREYMKNPKWRDESIRKSRRFVRDTDHIICNISGSGGKRKMDVGHNTIVGTRRKRFKAIMEELHKNSLDP